MLTSTRNYYERCNLEESWKNIDDNRPFATKRSSGRLFLPSLAFSYFATGPMGVLTGLLLIDIAFTFEVSVGAMGQINTVYYVVAVIFALFMGALSVQFRHKSLLMLGLLSVTISALGCFLASSFNLMLMLYSISGVGTAMVTPMAITLIGDYLSLDRRTNAIGWIVASGALTYIIGAPVISFIASFGGWRFVLLGFVLPISLASLLLAFFGLPSESRNHEPAVSKGVYLRSFEGVLSNRSATACLAGNILRSIAFMVVLLYGISFFREHFLVSTGFASIVMLGAASSYTLGSLICGQFVNRFGRKTSTVWTALLAGIFTISFAYVPNLWLSLALNFLGAWFFGMGASAANSLTLEQVPKFRGTMMSLTSAAQSLGSALGAALGGVILVLYDYLIMGSVLGALGIVAAIVIHFLALDPTRT